MKLPPSLEDYLISKEKWFYCFDCEKEAGPHKDLSIYDMYELISEESFNLHDFCDRYGENYYLMVCKNCGLRISKCKKCHKWKCLKEENLSCNDRIIRNIIW